MAPSAEMCKVCGVAHTLCICDSSSSSDGQISISGDRIEFVATPSWRVIPIYDEYDDISLPPPSRQPLAALRSLSNAGGVLLRSLPLTEEVDE